MIIQLDKIKHLIYGPINLKTLNFQFYTYFDTQKFGKC